MKLFRALTHPLRVRVTETTGTDRRTYRHRARDLTDAPRVMIPKNGGCWHN